MRILVIGRVSERFGRFEFMSGSGMFEVLLSCEMVVGVFSSLDMLEVFSSFVVAIMMRLLLKAIGFRGQGDAAGFSCYAEGDELSGGIE